ncbi:MAG: hypothetical protein HQK62_13965 [Desulfamplus sp.]|nr:hypothetical protein [Desulfamplus sp.]
MATLELATSPNTKVIIVGGGENGLPIIFNADTSKISSSSNKREVPSHTEDQSMIDEQLYDQSSDITDIEDYKVPPDVKNKNADITIKTNKK